MRGFLHYWFGWLWDRERLFIPLAIWAFAILLLYGLLN
jgi:hypothetical protein